MPDEAVSSPLSGHHRLKPWQVVVTLVATVVLATVVAFAIARPGTRSASTVAGSEVSYVSGGGRAESFALVDLRQPSKRISLASLRGHLVVLNFWASWCVPCRKEMPLLENVYRSVRERVVFLGVDTNDVRSAGLAFATKTDVTYLLASDPNAKVATDYGVFGLPTTFFIDARGQIVGHEIGELRPSTLAYALRQLEATQRAR